MIEKDIIEDIFKEPEYKSQYTLPNTPQKTPAPAPIKEAQPKDKGAK
jgi:hypothetical protein